MSLSLSWLADSLVRSSTNSLSLSLIRYLVHSGVKDWAVTNNAVVWQWRWWIGGRHLIINNTSDQSPPAFFARLYQLFDRKLSLQTWSNWISIPTPWALSDPAAPSYSSGEFKQRRSQEMGVLGRQSRISITVLVVVLLVPGDWGRITIRGEIWYWLSKLVQSLHLVVVLQCEGLRTPPSPAESQLPLSVQSLSSTDLGGPARSHYPYISWLGENLSRWWETWGGGCHWAFHFSNDNYLIILRSIEALIWILASSDEISFGS